MRDLKANVVTAEGKHRALALWVHSRDWDPSIGTDTRSQIRTEIDVQISHYPLVLASWDYLQLSSGERERRV